MLLQGTQVEHYRQEFSDNQITRLDSAIESKQIEPLTLHVNQHVPFKSAFIYQGDVHTLNQQEFQTLPRDQQMAVQKEINGNAARGFGFLYGTYKLDDRMNKDAHPILAKLFEQLNSDETLQKIRDITGVTSLVSANAQVTSYTPGQFLTRHNDVNEKEGRRIAYVISLTKQWHPDWGGLLQFFMGDGTPTQAYSPVFNSMMLFDVRHPHSVTYVTPFAQQPRLSITGWFLEK